MRNHKKTYQKTAEGVVLTSVAANLQLFIQFFTIVWITRYLSVRDFGIYSFVFTTVTLLGFVSSLALFPISRFVPDFLVRHESRLAKRLVRFALGYALAVSLVVACLFYFFPGALNLVSRDNIFSPSLLHLFSWIILFSVLSEVLDITLIAQIDVRYRVFARFLYTVLTFALTVLSLYFGFGLKGVLWAQVGALGTLLLLSWIRVNRTLFSLPDQGGQRLHKRPILRYSFFAQLALIGDLFTSLTVDIYLISYWLGSQAVGVYTFGIKIPQTIIANSPTVLGAAVVFPYIVQIYSRTGNKEELGLFFTFYTRFTAFLAFPLLFGMIILAEPLIRIVFNPEYLASLDVYVAASCYFAVYSFRFALIPIYNTIKKPEFGFYPKLAFLVSAGVIVYLLSHGHGVASVIKVNLAAIAVIYLTEYFLTMRHVPLRIPWTGLLKSFVSGLLMGALLVVLVPFIKGFFSMTCAIFFGAATYIGISYRIKPFDAEDKGIMERAGRVGVLLRHFRKEA